MVGLVYLASSALDIHSLEPNHLFHWLSYSVAIRNIRFSAQSFPGVTLPVETRQEMLGQPGRAPLPTSAQCRHSVRVKLALTVIIQIYGVMRLGWVNKRF